MAHKVPVALCVDASGASLVQPARIDFLKCCPSVRAWLVLASAKSFDSALRSSSQNFKTLDFKILAELHCNFENFSKVPLFFQG
jgi:hypothetical protein